MGKRRYNQKARQVVKTNIDNTLTNEIKLDFATNEYRDASDPNNLLVLPSKKRKTKIILEKKEKISFLSRAQRKRLEKIVDKKKKKENRAALLESLSHVQASPDEMKQLTSISAVQTVGLRKLNEINLATRDFVENQNEEDRNKKTNSIQNKKINCIRGAKKRLRLLGMLNENKKEDSKFNGNVVGLEELSCYETTSSESDDDEEPHTVSVEDSKANEIIEIDSEKVEENADISENVESGDKLKGHDDGIINDDVKHNKPVSNVKKISWDTSKNTEQSAVKEEMKKPLLEPSRTPVDVNRDPKIQVARLKLPILGEEQSIMELINENDIVIISGETGSGKTTQIPQFLYEAGYAEKKMIAVTEPRRVATVAMAARVGYELGLSSNEVSYLMRFEGNVTKSTKIKFMTDGVLLKEMETDFLLSKYSVVIIDEAHERSAYTDILLGLLSRTVPLRRKKGVPLRLIIMSATMRLQDFTENTRLFKEPPPVINVEARQFQVAIHFNKRTYSDYLKEAYRKTVKIHTRLPEGGILIFVTGKQEVHYLVRKLKAAFPYRKHVDYSKLITKTKVVSEQDAALDSEPDDIEFDDDEVEKEMKRARKARKKAKVKAKTLPKINLDDYDMPDDDGYADLVDNDDESEGHLSDSDDEGFTPAIKSCRQPLWVLPLYSMLSSPKQARVFAPPPVGARLCVVSTDVAETSLTIPNIKYVVDTGKKKMRVYDPRTGASAWRVVWSSQASAIQRAGRAGRTRAGHAYRLYSTAVYGNECPPQYEPDLCRRPPDQLLLQMRCMGIDKVANFPFPTAPNRLHLELAEKRLEILELLEKPQMNNKTAKDEKVLMVTPLGRAVSSYPVLPRYGKMLALSHQQNLVPYSIIMVSALSTPEVLTGKSDQWPATGHMLLLGDPGVLLRVVGGTDYAASTGDEESFCANYGIRQKAIAEIRKLRKQLTSEINLNVEGAEITIDPKMKPPNDVQARFLRQVVLMGLGDQVAKKIGLNEVKQGQDKRKFKYAYHCGELEEPVYMHSDSILRKVIPEWVVYQELYETGPDERKKIIMRNITAIEPEWLPLYVPKLCNLGEPLSEPEPRYDEKSGKVKCHFKGTFGKAGWELPIVEIDYPNNIDRYRYFGQFLLEGAVFPKLKKFKSSMLSPPSTMIKSWAKLHARTDILLKALIMKRAGTKDELTKIWQETPKYLLGEYMKWLPVSAHNDIMLIWPPL